MDALRALHVIEVPVYALYLIYKHIAVMEVHSIPLCHVKAVVNIPGLFLFATASVYDSISPALHSYQMSAKLLCIPERHL